VGEESELQGERVCVCMYVCMYDIVAEVWVNGRRVGATR
jgi:hypothetical protein